MPLKASKLVEPKEDYPGVNVPETLPEKAAAAYGDPTRLLVTEAQVLEQILICATAMSRSSDHQASGSIIYFVEMSAGSGSSHLLPLLWPHFQWRQCQRKMEKLNEKSSCRCPSTRSLGVLKK